MFSRTIRIALAAVSLTALPAIAYAGGNGKDAAGHVKDKGEKGEKAQFPMKAAPFRAKVESRITKGRERLVAHLTKKNVAADKQKEILAKFDAATQQVRDATDKVCADGTVTKDEAKSVRELAKSLRHQGHDKGKDKGKEARRDHQRNRKDA